MGLLLKSLTQAASLHIPSQKIWQYTRKYSHITLAVKHSNKKLEKTIYKTDMQTCRHADMQTCRHAEWVGLLTNDNDDI